MGAVNKLTTRVKAHMAAASHRWPAKRLKVVLVTGLDGGELTAVSLGHILQRNGSKVGIISANFIEIGGERANGSDQADVLSDPFRLQALLAHMRRAGCEYAIIHVPKVLPGHAFAGITPALAIQRRCGDRQVGEPANVARRANWQKVLSLRPELIVVNRDDPCYQKSNRDAASVMSFGVHEKAESRIVGVEMHPKGSAITLLVDHQTEVKLITELTGKTAIYSLVAAASAAYLLHVSVEVIENGVTYMPPYSGLLQYVPVQRPYQVVIDTNSTPDGIDETLETLKHFTKNRLVAVVGAQLSQPAGVRPIIGELVARHADRVVVTDGEYGADESSQTVRKQLLDGVVNEGTDAKAEEVADRKEAIEKAIGIARRNDIVVLLASTKRPYRQIGTERLTWSDQQQLDSLL